MSDPVSAAVQKEIFALQSQLGAPYPEAVTKPIAEALTNTLTNFLRNGPHRKVFVLYQDSGDYQYDPDMTQEAEYGMGAECTAAYKEALVFLEGLFGRRRVGRPAARRSYYEPDSDDFPDKEDQEYDGIVWSPEYEGGPEYTEIDTLCHWEVNGEYIFLQEGRWTGDDNFEYFTLMTVTQKTNTPESPVESRSASSARAPARPKELHAIEEAIGDTLRKVKSCEVMDGFKSGSYSVDSNGQITGLNLRNAHLTSLEALKGLRHLEKLSLSDNALTDISDIAHLDSLCELSLGSNLITNLDGIERLTKLTALNLNDNRVRSLEKLKDLTGLRELYVHANAIVDLEPLRNLPELVELGIAGNEISDVGALKDLVKLKILKAEGNNIGDLDVLVHLKKLRTLQIDRNPAVKKMNLKLKESENHLDAVRAALKQG
jgi:hypothetical protein